MANTTELQTNDATPTSRWRAETCVVAAMLVIAILQAVATFTYPRVGHLTGGYEITHVVLSHLNAGL